MLLAQSAVRVRVRVRVEWASNRKTGDAITARRTQEHAAHTHIEHYNLLTLCGCVQHAPTHNITLVCACVYLCTRIVRASHLARVCVCVCVRVHVPLCDAIISATAHCIMFLCFLCVCVCIYAAAPAVRTRCAQQVYTYKFSR